MSLLKFISPGITETSKPVSRNWSPENYAFNQLSKWLRDQLSMGITGQSVPVPSLYWGRNWGTEKKVIPSKSQIQEVAKEKYNSWVPPLYSSLLSLFTAHCLPRLFKCLCKPQREEGSVVCPQGLSTTRFLSFGIPNIDPPCTYTARRSSSLPTSSPAVSPKTQL